MQYTMMKIGVCVCLFYSRQVLVLSGLCSGTLLYI